MPREIVTNGRLPGEVIQRIIRQNSGRFRNCYEAGLRTNPSLEGRVAVRFVIDRSGQVSIAQDGDSDLPDASVRSCIVRSFYDLSFPSPQGGTVSVTYPIVLSPAQ
jgi:outer membrane biosynthesis protein TonB